MAWCVKYPGTLKIKLKCGRGCQIHTLESFFSGTDSRCVSVTEFLVFAGDAGGLSIYLGFGSGASDEVCCNSIYFSFAQIKTFVLLYLILSKVTYNVEERF